MTIFTSKIRTIYFVGRPDKKCIKIGISENASMRLNQIRQSFGHDMEMFASAPGSFRDERFIHKKLAYCRISGEWFSWCAELEFLIEQISSTGVIPTNFLPEPEHIPEQSAKSPNNDRPYRPFSDEVRARMSAARKAGENKKRAAKLAAHSALIALLAEGIQQ